MSPELVTPRQALARLNVSRTLFESRFRPQLTEYPLGERAIRFDWTEIAALVAESAAPKEEEGNAMFLRRTIQDALDHAWRIKWSKAKGARKKQQLMNVVGRDVGAKRLGGFGYNELEQWVLFMQDADQAVATIKSKVSCLMTALKLVQPKGWIKVLPLVPPLGELDNTKLRWLNDDEEQVVLAACESQRRPIIADVMRDVIIFLIDTGARLGELVKVRDDSLSTRGQLTYVTLLDRKAGDDLHLPLTRRANESIRRLLANRYWQKRVRGCRESAKRANSAQNWLTHRVSEIRDAAKLPDVSAHTFRHTCGSRLVQRGVSIYRVQKWLGHSDIRQTERYAHLAPSSLDDTVQVLEQVSGENVTRIGDYRKRDD